jgi:hypothetical protein
MAHLFDGYENVPFPADKTISVQADAVVCRASDVDIASRSCELTFGTKTATLKGRKIWGTSSPEDKLAGDLGNVIEATRIGARWSGRLMAGKLSPGNFGTFATISAQSGNCHLAERCLLWRVQRMRRCFSGSDPIKSATFCKVSSQQARLGRLWEDGKRA